MLFGKGDEQNLHIFTMGANILIFSIGSWLKIHRSMSYEYRRQLSFPHGVQAITVV